MGSFLSSIEHKGPIPSKNNDLFFDKTLQNIYEYHGLFKSVCEDFGINKHQFTEIFNTDKQFNNWESEKTGKVNGLEIFSSLILLAEECTFKEKIKFLFNIYDFNDIRSISTTDLQFMLVQICNSVYRLFQVNSKVNNYEMADIVAHHFDLTKRINITGMLSFCIHSPEVKSFMRFIRLPNSQIEELSMKVDHQIQGKFTDLLNQKIIKEKRKFIDQEQTSRYTDLLKKILPSQNRTQKLVTCKESWVYGIKTDDIQTPFIYLESQILYLVSCIAVIYNPCLNSQKLYTQHQSEIISVCYSSIKDVVITSQKCQNPAIFIWKSSSLSTIQKIITPHQNGIHLMTLMNNDTKLVTGGLRTNTSIIIYSLDTYECLQSFYIPELLTEMVSTINLVEEVEGHNYILNSFIACSSKNLYYCDCSNKEVSTILISTQKDRSITSICCAYLNLDNPYLSAYVRQSTSNFIGLVGFQTGQLSMITLKNSKESLKDIFSLKGAVSNIKINNEVFAVSASNSVYLFKLSNLNQEVSPFKVLAIDEIGNYKLLSNVIRYFSVHDKEMIVLTNEGQILQIKEEKWIIEKESVKKRWLAQKLCTFLKISRRTTALSIVQQKIAYVTSHNNRVMSIDLENHLILEVWSIPETITAMDVISFQQGIIVYAIGKQPGTLMLRIAGQQHPRTFYCGAQIIDIKIASDYSYLSLCTQDSHIFVFSNTSNNLLSQAPKKLKFQNQRPLSINFSDDNKSFFVCTNIRNIYQFYLPDLKNKNVFKDNDKIYISYWNLIYCYNPYNQEQQNLPALLGSSQKPFVLTTPSGEMRCFQNINQLMVNSYSKLKSHLGPICKLVMCPEQQKFYSLGARDNALIEWKLQSLGKQIQNNSIQINSLNNPDLLTIQNCQLAYSKYDQLCKRIQKDAFVLFRGISKNIISQFYGRSKQIFNENDRAYPNLTIRPKHVYGVCSSKGKNTYFNPNNPLEIIYFTSRFICAINFQTQQQQITSCTRMKISCIAVNKQGVIAAGESAENPIIFIVNGKNFLTTHKQGIIHMSFFQDFIFSFAIHDSIYSINKHDWKKGKLIEQRFVQERIQNFIVLNQNQFLSFPEIKIWKKMRPSETLGYATASCVLQISQNICIASKSRDICIMKDKQIIKVKQNAHFKEINILISMKFKKGVLISGGRDELIKIWGANFEQLCFLQLKSCRAITRLSSTSIVPDSFQKQLIINNVDSMEDQVLVSLTNGQILLFSNVFDYVVSTSIVLEHASHRSHQYQHQIHIDVHPKYPFLVSIGDDNYLFVKDYVRKTILVHQHFPARPRAVRFSPNSKLLVIGFQNGQLLVFTITLDNQRIVLTQIQKFQDLTSSILSIQISECCSYIAVSFLPCYDNEDEYQGSKVLIYKNKDSDTFDNHYYKFWEIEQEKVQGHNLTSKLPNCACFLTFFKQKGNTSLLMYYQKVNQYALRIGRDPNGEFKLFDIQQKTLKKEEQLKLDWNNVKFPSYIQCSQILENLQNPMMTSMIFCKDSIMYGSANGDVYIVKKPSLHPIQGDNMKMSDMCLARTYPCLTSFISQLKISPDGKYLFCVSVTDQTIVQYDISTQPTVSAICDVTDEMKQSLTKEQFYNYLNTIVPLRDEIGQFLCDIQTPLTSCPVYIEKKRILGRRAYDRKNNLIYDGMGNLIFNVGTNIILQSITTNKQKYIPVNPQPDSSTYQISCIAFNLKNGLLAVSTQQFKSSVFIWNIHAKICTSQFEVDCSIVNQMSFSDDGQYLILEGLHKKYYSVCYLIKLQSSRVLGSISFVHENYWFLKSLCFKKNKNNQFITGGVQHLNLWTYQGQMLTFQSFQIQLLNVTFMSLVDTENYLVTGCQSGNLYIWNKLIMIYKVKIHQNCIQTMLLMQNNLIVSGCVRGQISITKIELEQYQVLNKWNLQDLYKSDKIEESQQDIMQSFNIKYSIQSLTTDNNQIYVGTKCGSIYSLNIKNKSMKIQSICHDNQKPISCCFDDENKRFMYVTNSGYLEVWNIQELRLVLSYEFQKKTRKIISYNDGLIIVFQKSIGFFDLDAPVLGIKDQYKIGLESYDIADSIINSSRTLLFVATTDKQKTQIFSYKLPLLSQHSKTLTVNMDLQYMDISLDDNYLLLKDKFQDIGIIQIGQFRRMNTIFIEFSVQWRSQAIRLNQDALSIHSCYNKDNPITQILYLSDNHLLVGDQLGTLRIFDYSISDKKLGQLHLACYTDHLNIINGLEISSNKKWVISMSEMDRSLILWEVKTQ